jgi:5-formyltetrahydrofolate cyclo-ligase
LLRRSLPDKEAASRQITLKVSSLPEFKQAGSVMIYAGSGDEVATDDLIDLALAAGKRVFIPFVRSHGAAEIRDRSELVAGPFGIRQPRPELPVNAGQLPDLDLVIVPGLAFDLEHHRLGRGSGWYDRFLSRLARGTTTVGLAYEAQITRALPCEDSDLPVEIIVTERRLF